MLSPLAYWLLTIHWQQFNSSVGWGKESRAIQKMLNDYSYM